MKSKWLKIVWLSLWFTIALSACAHLEVPAIEWCSSAGIFGALCQDSIDASKRRKLTMDEWVAFLTARPDDPTTPQNEEKGPALCTSSSDFAKIKTTLEQLCEKAKSSCTYEHKKIIEEVSVNVKTLQASVLQVNTPIRKSK